MQSILASFRCQSIYGEKICKRTDDNKNKSFIDRSQPFKKQDLFPAPIILRRGSKC